MIPRSNTTCQQPSGKLTDLRRQTGECRRLKDAVGVLAVLCNKIGIPLCDFCEKLRNRLGHWSLLSYLLDRIRYAVHVRLTVMSSHLHHTIEIAALDIV